MQNDGELAERDTNHAPRVLAGGAALGFLAVGCGAFGAHGLKNSLEGAADAAERLGWWETAAHYHLMHALALVGVGLASHILRRRMRLAAGAFALGIVVFSGTLYAMALGAPRWFGAITPIGGVALMAGWIALLSTALRSSRAPAAHPPR